MTSPNPPDTEPTSGQQTLVPRGMMMVALGLFIPLILTIMLAQLASILQPLLVAIFLAYLIVPAHHWLIRHRIPSLVSYVFIVGTVVFVIYGVGSMVYASLDELWAKVPIYAARLQSLLAVALERLVERFPTLEKLPLQEQLLLDTISAENITRTARTTLGTFIGFLTNLLVVAFYLLFILAEVRTFNRRLGLAFSETQAQRIMEVLVSINKAIAQYVLIKTFVSLVLAALATAVLAGFGVDFYIMWGILTFLANFIPYIGSLVVTAIPILLAFLQFDSPWRAAAVAVMLILIQELTGYVLEPRLTGERLGVSPLMILLSLAFWGWLWGIIGMILAVPLVVIIKIILGNIEQTRPVAVLISNI